MAQMIFYQNIIPLDREQHRDLRVRNRPGYAPQARETHYVPLGGAEFFQAARDYPIVFSGEGDTLGPVALLGLREGENLFLDDHDQWRGGVHLPAFVRRYPFILADNGEGSGFSIGVDEDSEVLSRAEGDPLFTDDGEYSEALNGYIRLMQEFYQDMQRTRALTQRLVDLDVLVERAVEIGAPDGRTFQLGGLKFVDEQRLAGLSDEQLVALQRDGYLGRVYAHLVSVGNLQRLAADVPA
ncbi:SapC family protein [Arhodomonas sp. AD133]|uniref:SapC family protein n=1 Tax=Arhodomonas sp. AD133 TaxID=3415009 RepID=UPI003EC0F240